MNYEKKNASKSPGNFYELQFVIIMNKNATSVVYSDHRK